MTPARNRDTKAQRTPFVSQEACRAGRRSHRGRGRRARALGFVGLHVFVRLLCPGVAELPRDKGAPLSAGLLSAGGPHCSGLLEPLRIPVSRPPGLSREAHGARWRQEGGASTRPPGTAQAPCDHRGPWRAASRGPRRLSSRLGLCFHRGGSWGTSELGRVTMRKCEGTVFGDLIAKPAEGSCVSPLPEVRPGPRRALPWPAGEWR